MGDSLKYVTSGQPLKIPAQTFNTFINMAKAFQRARQNVSRQPRPAINPNLVLVRNDSGEAVGQYEAMGISGVVYAADEGDGFTEIVLTVVIPTADHKGQFVVTAEPIAIGGLGLAHVAGICQVQINVTEATVFKLCDVSAGFTVLEPCWDGSATILHQGVGIGVNWGIVRLGNPPWGAVDACGGGGGADPPAGSTGS